VDTTTTDQPDQSAAIDPADTAPATQDTTAPAEPATADLPAFRMIAVADLAAHPGNCRDDLKITPGFVRSVKAGVRVPLHVKQHPDGGHLEIVMGHRRLAAAIEGGVAALPCLVVPAGPVGDDYLAMFTENTDRENFTAYEQAAALFAANEAGYSPTKIAKLTGRRIKDVRAGIKVAGLPDAVRKTTQQADYDWTLDQLAELDEFADDPDAIARIAAEAREGRFDYGLNDERERIAAERAEQVEHDRIRAELTQAGIPIVDEAPPGSARLGALMTTDEQDLTPDLHATCPGAAAAFYTFDRTRVYHLCTDPEANGHRHRYGRPFDASGAAAPDSGSDRLAAEASARRRRTIAGNRQWKAATKARQAFLRALIGRSRTPREISRFVTEQLLNPPAAVGKWFTGGREPELLAALTGTPSGSDPLAGNVPDKRLPLLQFAVIAAALERSMDAYTWRTDTPLLSGSRATAGRYLAFLATIGHTLSPIEQAVADGTSYAEPAADTLSAAAPNPAQPGPDPADESEGDDEAGRAGPAADLSMSGCQGCGVDADTDCAPDCPVAAAQPCPACTAEPGEPCRPGCLSDVDQVDQDDPADEPDQPQQANQLQQADQSDQAAA
jgi:ParB family chromosome partitioning protein